MRWNYEKLEGFWPQKARDNPRGKVNFPLRIIPWLSPDALHPGLASKGRRARSIMITNMFSFLIVTAEANIVDSFYDFIE